MAEVIKLINPKKFISRNIIDSKYKPREILYFRKNKREGICGNVYWGKGL